MLYAFVVMENRAEATLLSANLVGTFAITLVHIIFPEGSFFSKVSYRVQSLITVIVFLGSYCGNYVWIYNIVPRFDLFLHLISGVLCVMGGYYIALTLIKPDSRKNVLIITGFAALFSFFIMPAWEISEFVGDFIWGTANQGFYWGPTDESFLFKVFGWGAHNTALYPLYDTFYDVLECSSKPVVATHSCCRALCAHPRNMTDDMIKALAASGGVVQINFYPYFLDESYVEGGVRPSFRLIADHIDHVVSLAGVDHVGIGSDYDGIEVTPSGMEDISAMHILFDELRRRGYSESDLEKIASGNFFRILE